VLAPGVRAREAWAWAMFDFANSGYTTVVVTAVYNAYFVAVIAGNAPWATFAWTAALSISYVLIMLTAPAIGAYADAAARKKRLLGYASLGCIVFTALLGAAGPGEVALAMALIVLSNYCFGSGENLIAAFLPQIARGEHIGRVSGWGWALGYLGGMGTLALCLAYVQAAQARGMTASDFVPGTLLITAGVFALACLPTFLFLRERAVPRPEAAAVHASFARLKRTLAEARRFRDLARFLLCIVCYQAGVQAVIALAAIYAQQAMHFTTAQTIVLVLVVNVAAAAGAFLFGYVQDKVGHKRAIGITLAGWLATTVLAAGADGERAFWIAAHLAGLCLGSSQSAGRALVGYLSPEDRHGEFFGLWGLAVKLSSVLGPMTYGLIVWLTHGEHRLAFALTGIYFILGLVLLVGVDVMRGRAAALAR